MFETTPEPLRTALLEASAIGLRLARPTTAPDWVRIACPACGGWLDLATPDAAALPADGGNVRLVRRVDAFVSRHRSERTHR